MATIADQIVSPSRRRLDVREPGSPDLLEFLSSQHVTQRSVCELLARLAVDPDNVTAPYDAAAVIDCIAEWLPLHASIEERYLFGLIERRRLPDEDVATMMAQWQAGHRESRALADDLMGGLHDIATGRRLSNPTMFRATAMALCSHHRSLVQWEDEVLYRFARQRLDAHDLDDLATDIASGRGRSDLMPWADAAGIEAETASPGVIRIGAARRHRSPRDTH